MKRLILFTLFFTLLIGCGSQPPQPPFVDNGNPGQIKAIVFYDDNKNGVMDSNEIGALQRLATTTCNLSRSLLSAFQYPKFR